MRLGRKRGEGEIGAWLRVRRVARRRDGWQEGRCMVI